MGIKVRNDVPVTSANRELQEIGDRLRALLMSTPPGEFMGEGADPYATRLAAAGFRAIGAELEEAARLMERND